VKQLYVTDLDHTFLHSNQTISPFSKEIWNEKAENSFLTVATARGFNKSQEFLKGLKLDVPLILLDGAMIVDSNKRLIDVKVLGKEISDAIINEGEKFNLSPFVISLDDHKTLAETFALPPSMGHFQSSLIEKSYSRDPRIKYMKKIEGAKETLKIVYMDEEERLRPLYEQLKKVFGETLEIKLSPENYMNCYFLTILHPLGDKANGLKIICDYLDIPFKSTTVFGDGLNDIEMFKLAGTSVAVSNALDSVKQQASIISSFSNDEDAVAKYLQEIRG